MNRNKIVPAVLLVALAQAAGAQDGQQATPISPTKGSGKTSIPNVARPENSPLTWDELEHDWGDIPESAPVSVDFHFKNNSGSKVTIRETRTPCGCTIPVLSKKEYAPGESGVLTVNFNPLNRAGPQRKSVTVLYEDSVSAPTVLSLSANVKPLAILDPPKLSLNDVERGRGRTAQLQVSGRAADFRVTAVECINPFLTAVIGEPHETLVNAEHLMASVIEFTVSPEAPIGELEAVVRIHTTEPKRSTIDYSVFATVVGDLFASPQAISIREFNAGYPFTHQAVIDTRSSLPFNITSVDIESGAGSEIVVDIETIDRSERKLQVVRISGRLPRTAGPIKGALVIKTDSADGDLRIPYFANVRGWSGQPEAQTPGSVQ